MQIKYTPTFADYWDLNLHVLRKQGRTIGFFAGALVILFAISPFVLPRSQDLSVIQAYRNTLGVLILPGIVAFIVASTFWTAKKRWATAPELSEYKEYEFDDSGIRLKSSSLCTTVEWRVFKEATITGQFVYIATAQRQYHYFPVHVVPDLAALTALIQSKVKTKLQ